MKRLEGCVPEPGVTSFVFEYDWISLNSTIIKKPTCSAQQLTRHESVAHTMLINTTLAPSRMQAMSGSSCTIFIIIQISNDALQEHVALCN